MEIEAFNKLAGDMDMADIIRRAKPAYPPRRQAKPAPATEKLDYSTLEHAGKPHRGKATEAEKETVRNNLTAINERLKRDGVVRLIWTMPSTWSGMALKRWRRMLGTFCSEYPRIARRCSSKVRQA